MLFPPIFEFEQKFESFVDEFSYLGRHKESELIRVQGGSNTDDETAGAIETILTSSAKPSAGP